MTPPLHRVSPLSEQDQERVTADVIAQLKAAGLGQPVEEPLSLKSQWLQKLLLLVLAALVAYFTTNSTMDKAIGQIDERENNHFAEVLRRMDAIQADVRELRSRP